MTHRRALSGGVEMGTNERHGIWSCDLWANEKKGTYIHADGHRYSMTESVKMEPKSSSSNSEKKWSQKAPAPALTEKLELKSFSSK